MNEENRDSKKTVPKKKILLVVSIATAIVIILGIAIAVFIKSRNMLPKETVIDTIEKEFDYLIGYDEKNSNSFVAAMHDGFEVEVKTVSKKENQYVASCMLSNYDFKKSLETVDTSSEMTLNEYTEKFLNNLAKQEKVIYKTKIIIKEEKDYYTASFTEEQLDGATGGLIDSYKTMFKEGE